MLNRTIHIVGICGSLRKHSYNLGLLRAFNEDREQPYPQSVLTLKEQLDSADAVIISTPEYNLSYTGVLKNTFAPFITNAISG